MAVLPFLDMSSDGSNAYFADGITEELLNVLARVPGLRVAARTSSFAFRGKDVPIDSIARTLDVTHVLEGSVRTAGRRVRITAQLIETAGGFHVWSETYDRDLDDIFAVQDEIAAAIAKELQLKLAGNFWGLSARETKDPEAYRTLLRALHAFRAPSPENYATSAALLGEALRRDPGYARAYGAPSSSTPPTPAPSSSAPCSSPAAAVATRRSPWRAVRPSSTRCTPAPGPTWPRSSPC